MVLSAEFIWFLFNVVIIFLFHSASLIFRPVSLIFTACLPTVFLLEKWSLCLRYSTTCGTIVLSSIVPDVYFLIFYLMVVFIKCVIKITKADRDWNYVWNFNLAHGVLILRTKYLNTFSRFSNAKREVFKVYFFPFKRKILYIQKFKLFSNINKWKILGLLVFSCWKMKIKISLKS